MGFEVLHLDIPWEKVKCLPFCSNLPNPLNGLQRIVHSTVLILNLGPDGSSWDVRIEGRRVKETYHRVVDLPVSCFLRPYNLRSSLDDHSTRDNKDSRDCCRRHKRHFQDSSHKTLKLRKLIPNQGESKPLPLYLGNLSCPYTQHGPFSLTGSGRTPATPCLRDVRSETVRGEGVV